MKYKICSVRLGDGTFLYNVLKKNWRGGYYAIHTVSSFFEAKTKIPLGEPYDIESK